MLEEFPGSWWQSPAWEQRFPWTSRDVQLMLPTLKIKFVRGALPHLHNFLLGLLRMPFLRPRGSASGYSAPLSGLICLEPNLTPWLQRLVALSNICAYYLPGPMPSMIPNTAMCPRLVPDQEPVVRARLPYSISLLRSYSTENKGV